MKDKLPWTIDDQGFVIEFAEELADCGEFLHMDELTAGLGMGADDIYELADRLSNILGRGQPLVVEAEADPVDASRTSDLLAALLAGYTDCMDEAIRYLVEEEQYSMEHPAVQGLRQHLMAQQERFLLDAARSQHNNNVNNNNNSNNSAAADALSRIALLVETFSNTRPPSG